MTCVYETTAHANRSSDKDLYLVYLKSIKDKFGEYNILGDTIDKEAHKLTPSFNPHDDDSVKGIRIISKADVFGSSTPSELELYATAVFVFILSIITDCSKIRIINKSIM